MPMNRRSSELLSLEEFPVARTALDLSPDEDDDGAARAIFAALREHNEALDKQLNARGHKGIVADRGIAIPRRLTKATIVSLRALIEVTKKKELRLSRLVDLVARVDTELLSA